jgi:hypothetical protein
MREDAHHDLTSVKHAQMREPIERFLNDFERVAALSGPAFIAAASASMRRVRSELEAAHAAAQEPYDRQIREGFEAICRHLAELLDAQNDLDRSIATSDETHYRRQRDLREKAITLLADADRIRSLSGDDFAREATAAIEAFDSRELQAAKLQIYANATVDPLRRWRQKLIGRLSK